MRCLDSAPGRITVVTRPVAAVGGQDDDGAGKGIAPQFGHRRFRLSVSGSRGRESGVGQCSRMVAQRCQTLPGAAARWCPKPVQGELVVLARP